MPAVGERLTRLETLIAERAKLHDAADARLEQTIAGLQQMLTTIKEQMPRGSDISRLEAAVKAQADMLHQHMEQTNGHQQRSSQRAVAASGGAGAAVGAAITALGRMLGWW